ncbi:MAG: hypothetical protein JRH16_02100 [Deltaproteobacteria bacterium]|nr:hypothetical protein [Deltaproteobacteria bacterium]MBW2360524.1 hypothetical protein [Deltaproteobacteria bacterium]
MRKAAFRWKRWGPSVPALALAACLSLLGATPARAGNDLANGFEDQMGRLLAVEAFQFGRFLLSGGLHGGRMAPYATAWPSSAGVRTEHNHALDHDDPVDSRRRYHARRHRARHERYADHGCNHHERTERSERRPSWDDWDD